MARMVSMSEGQCWRAMLVREGKQRNVKDFTLIQSSEIHKERV